MARKNLLFSFLFNISKALLLIIISGVPAHSQVVGCKDPLANNYNPLATINNGTCAYNTTAYTPTLKVDPISDTLLETSGLQWAGNYLWSFNDGGGEAAIYRIDTISNALLQRVYLQGATNIDWEDIAFDGIYFYVGDFGNNVTGARSDLKIYKFPLSAIPDYIANPVVYIPSSQINIINFTYSDQQQPTIATGSNNTKFDCEAMIVDNGNVHLFSKNWIDLNCTHYKINSVVAGTYIATVVETLFTNYLVTAADKAIGNRVVALLGYQNSGTANHFMYLLSDYTGENYFSGNKRRIDLPGVTVMGQAEGITFKNGYYGYISNEKFVRIIGGFPFTVTPKLRAFDIRNYVSNLLVTYIFTGSGNWDEPSNWSDQLMPPPAMAANCQIIIDPLPGGECRLNIPYTATTGSPITVTAGKIFVVQGNLTQE